MEENNLSDEKKIYCSFFLNDSEFAVSVSHVQEVINTPDSYSKVPLAPDFLKGLINLRGIIIPVVDLKTVLNLNQESTVVEQKIAIIQMNGNFVGLLFDKTSEVFKGDLDERNDFLEDDLAIIKGVFKKDHGKRLVQILDIGSIFCLKNIPKRDNDLHLNNLRNNRGKRRQAISFFVDVAKCSIEINEIQEILMINKVNESALAVGNCIGTFDLRGVTVPIIDFAALLKYRKLNSVEDALNGDRRVVVMRIGNELFGLLVDKVDSIITFYDDELKHFPVLVSERIQMIKGCISIKDGEDVLLLNADKILTDSEVTYITHGHSKLYSTNEANSTLGREAKNNKRRTFITFSIEQEYAIGIGDIREIIDLPADLLIPPGMPAHFRGMFNLRGEMIIVVDSRSLYKKSKQDDEAKCKLLIFKTQSAHFGLLVDSVQSIISFSDNEKMKLPELMYRDKVGNNAVDIIEAVEYKTGNEMSKIALILDVNSIANRVMSKAS